MKVKALFLDFYGTVVHEDDVIVRDICNRIKESSNTNATVSEIGGYWWKVFSDSFTQSFGDDFQTQRDLEIQSLRQTLAHFDSSLDEITLSEWMFEHWQKPMIFTDAIEFIEGLQNKLPVYILSNIDRTDILSAISLHHLPFQEVITSEDVNSYKPRSEMFDYALKKYNLSAEEVLHIGDSLRSDIAGAQNLGIKTVWINRTNKPSAKNIQPDFTISKLTEILNII
ncbi:HAD family hydrolase [Jeotgalibacillus sp. R-1-5s-1]|uniref:HAD family hydrolase n=1 Tax=Jeotgalibacillus sp. R-1-5s-1 TaxID=2555897 RepID=UPI00106B10B2|nr:HAD family hydrolase [Jeotgalibacillus sp. R-1-5s-1]TFD92444.1 HAD family hydrolase [Jeotgalibacillus sp. R-1-5s-1]